MFKRRLSMLIISILLLLSACSSSSQLTGTQPGSVSPTARTGENDLPGSMREYTLPQANSDVMRPAIDHEGRIWFGEMGHNYLAVFDPHMQTFQQITPPHGASGIMGIAVAGDDSIWFAEQYANYIGHYNSTTRAFQTYALPELSTPDPSNTHNVLRLPSAPNDIAFDQRGNLWFTELNADAIGVLDPHTGHIKSYQLSQHATVQALDPYGIAVDPRGTVWFSESSANRLGRLDPRTGAIRTFSAPGTATLMEVASDVRGTIWATTFNTGQLFRFDPATAAFRAFNTSSRGIVSGGLYGLAIGPTGDIWVTLTQENAIGRLDLAAGRIISYQVPTAGSLPFGVVVSKDHRLWFTESGGNKVGMLEL